MARDSGSMGIDPRNANGHHNASYYRKATRIQCCPFRCRWLPAQHFMEKLLRLLIEEKADIQGKVRNQKRNTPALLAFGQGASDLGEFLLNADADRSATNSLGKGLLQVASGCSSTCASVLRAHSAPQTFSRQSGRTRTTEGGSSRQLRKARLAAQQQGSTARSSWQ